MQKAATADTAIPPATGPASAAVKSGLTVLPIIVALSFCHMLNDLMQSMIPALYPLLKSNLELDFTQIGLITLAFQLTASLLQPTVGTITDRKPQPYSLAIGMGSTLIGLIMLSMADSYLSVLLSAALIGVGSAVFHPEASRVARMASGGRYGFAQSMFQVGGNLGSAIGPLLAAFIVLPHGQGSIAWFSMVALVAMGVLTWVGNWYAARRRPAAAAAARSAGRSSSLRRGRVIFCIFILMVLLFSKNVYSASLGSYFVFYLMHHFGSTVADSQVQLFIYMAAVATGTLLGGQFTDRIGRLPMIWISIVGALPFTLLLPYADLFWTSVLTIVIAMLMASAFPAIMVYGQELVPGRVGMIAGMFFGFSFGLGGLGAAALGRIADATSIEFVYHLTSFLPVLGLVTIFLPKLEHGRR